ncbi:uncharacterized protein K02A2.6-like [Malaya genurostris]|uniref:uncharacterized protein K02A2.6-like n=1 Tax=Malaya genurostris TaxID=325434 RepID=UPI0026F3E0A6|nr:uncharacterized protein K02A2.6-like [Malaya genurostris]
MDLQVEQHIKNCRGCMLVAAPSAPEPMKRRELPSGPWQHLAVDFLGPLPSSHYLFVVVDYFSRYLEIEIMTKIDTKETINRLEIIFARFGLPLSITADNGPQFSSVEFRVYCESNNIKLINTIPYWPQQNGEVERQNRSILKRLTISQGINSNWIEDLNKYLLMYRSTPHSTTEKTPSEMLLGYYIRDKLPCIYQPKEVDEEVIERDKEMKEKGKLYADKRRHAKVNHMSEGDNVLVKNMIKSNKLTPTFGSESCKVIKRKGGDVVIASESGAKYRRHITHLQDVSKSLQVADNSNDTTNRKVKESVEESTVNSRIKRAVQQPIYMQDYVQTVDGDTNKDSLK